MNLIGKNIKKIRLQKQLSQREITAKCNLLGWDISRGTFAKIESKNRKISDIEVWYLATALNVDINTLFN